MSTLFSYQSRRWYWYDPYRLPSGMAGPLLIRDSGFRPAPWYPSEGVIHSVAVLRRVEEHARESILSREYRNTRHRIEQFPVYHSRSQFVILRPYHRSVSMRGKEEIVEPRMSLKVSCQGSNPSSRSSPVEQTDGREVLMQKIGSGKPAAPVGYPAAC